MEAKLEEAVKQMKKNSNTSVYNALLLIRTKYLREEDCIAKIRQAGVLQWLLYHIQKPNQKIAELALSILGNCCLDLETRKAVHELKGVKCIVRILESLEKESILNRACRTLANLALDEDIAREIHRLDTSKPLIRFLATTKDDNFLQTVLRALRILSGAPEHRAKANENGGTECLAKLLVVSKEKDNEEVLLCVLRALATLTTDCSVECARQMQNTECLEKLVVCATDSRDGITEVSLHVLANLSRRETLRPALGNAGVVSILIQKVATWEKTSGWQWAVDALCQCTKEAINRVRVREGGGLVHLVGLLKETEDERLWLCSLASVVNFLYDSASITALVDLGMVNVLVERFRLLISRENPVQHKCPPNGGEVDGNPSDSDQQQQLQPQVVHRHHLRVSVDSAYEGDQQHSVRSCPMMVSPGCGASYSPECSPPYWPSFPISANVGMSPASMSPFRSWSPNPMTEPSGEFCYSPVYELDEESDDDGGSGVVVEGDDANSSTGESFPGRELESPAVSLAEKIEDDECYNSDAEESLKRISEGRSPLGDILVLFSRLSLQEDPSLLFLKSGSFMVLLDYLTTVEFPQPRAKRILLRIARNPLCFEPMVLSYIPTCLTDRLLTTKHLPSECLACTASYQLGDSLVTSLRLHAESAFGCGVLEHMLIGKTETEEKLAAAVAMTCLLGSSNIRRKLSVESTSLSVLISSLSSDDNNVSFDRAVCGLTFLANSLFSGDNPKKATEIHAPCEAPPICHYSVRRPPSNAVAVRLCAHGHEGSISADRHFLSSKSDVFRATLCGHFLESTQETVTLNDTSFRAIEFVVHWLHGCRFSSCKQLSASCDVASLLDVLALSDKLLLDDLKAEVGEKLVVLGWATSAPDVEELTEVMIHAKLYSCPALRRWVYVRLLTNFRGEEASERQKRFRKFMECGEQVASDCQDVFLEELRSRCVDDRLRAC